MVVFHDLLDKSKPKPRSLRPRRNVGLAQPVPVVLRQAAAAHNVKPPHPRAFGCDFLAGEADRRDAAVRQHEQNMRMGRRMAGAPDRLGDA